MQQSFDIEEVLTIAIRIEVNGQAFYREAAKLCPEHAGWLTDLADQETSHEATYTRLKDDLVDRAGRANLDAGDYDDLAVAYLHSIAGSVVFKLSRSPEEEFTGREGIEEIIDRAIEREQDAVLFFTGIRKALRNEQARGEIDLIIDEEMRHVSELQARKRKLTNEARAESLSKVLDVIIVGAGPAGIAVAAEGISRGVDSADILVLEKADKNSWIIRKLYPEQKLVTANYKGQSGECEGVMKMRNMHKTDALSMLSETIADYGIQVLHEAGVLSIDREDGVFRVSTASEVFRAKTCVVSIGVFGKPNKPDYKIPTKVRKNTQFDVTSSVLENVEVLVVGGGDSASEYVQHLVSAGCRVSISSREADFSYMNGENRTWIRKNGEDGTITVFAGTEIEQVEEHEDRVKATFKDGAPAPIIVDRLVYALGGTTPMNFLKLSGVEFDGANARLSEANETSVEGLYLVGDLAAPKNHGAIATAFNTAFATANDLTKKGRWKAG